MFGHARVFPPPLCRGLLEGDRINVFKSATVCGKVVGDVLGGGGLIFVIFGGVFQTPRPRVLDGSKDEVSGTIFGGM